MVAFGAAGAREAQDDKSKAETRVGVAKGDGQECSFHTGNSNYNITGPLALFGMTRVVGWEGVFSQR